MSSRDVENSHTGFSSLILPCRECGHRVKNHSTDTSRDVGGPGLFGEFDKRVFFLWKSVVGSQAASKRRWVLCRTKAKQQAFSRPKHANGSLSNVVGSNSLGLVNLPVAALKYAQDVMDDALSCCVPVSGRHRLSSGNGVHMVPCRLRRLLRFHTATRDGALNAALNVSIRGLLLNSRQNGRTSYIPETRPNFWPGRVGLQERCAHVLSIRLTCTSAHDMFVVCRNTWGCSHKYLVVRRRCCFSACAAPG